METTAKPRVFISYTWLDEEQDGKWVRVPDKRAFELAERLHGAGFDSRLDLYFKDSHHGFRPPERVPDDNRDPWIIWAEKQIRDADCVLLLCTPEYAASDYASEWWPGGWREWHDIPDNLKVEKKPSAFLWWDWHFIAKELESGKAEPQKFIPVGFGPYDPQCIPTFVRGATYCNLKSKSDFEGLLRRIKSVYRRRHPRRGVFISYAHKDEKWLDSLLGHLTPLKRHGVEIWTDRDIKPGARWHDEIQNSLARAQVAVLLVTPAFLESTYIASHELSNLLQAAESEGLVIFWIPVKPSSYKLSEIAQFHAAHPPSEPLSGLDGAKRDEALVNITSRLANALGVNKANVL